MRTLALAILAVSGTASAGALRGTVVSVTDGKPAPGATLVAIPIGGSGEYVAITEDDGTYAIAVPPGTYDVVVYWNGGSVEAAHHVVTSDADTWTGVAKVRDEPQKYDCVLVIEVGPENTSEPRFGLSAHRTFNPVARDRTHLAWIAPAVAADANAVTRVDHGARLAGAPGIPTAFVQEVDTTTLRTAIERPAGAGGSADVALRGGSNQSHGEVFAVLDGDRAGGEAFVSGPLREDKAWFAAGLVGDSERATAGMLRLDYASSSDRRFSTAAIVQDAAAARDAWGSAQWEQWTNSHRTQLLVTATGEALERTPDVAAKGEPDLASVVRRAGVDAQLLSHTLRIAGYHDLAVAAGVGAGDRDDTRTADAQFAIGDVWRPRSDVEISAGVRGDTRTFGDARATVTSPRLSLGYDITREGRSDLFVAYQRVPHLDDGAPGAWRDATARFHDELAAGASYQLAHLSSVMAGVAARVRWSADGDERGVEGYVRHDTRRTAVLVAASSLGRVASVVGQHAFGKDRPVTAYVTLRASPDATEGGAALAYRRKSRRRWLETRLEGFDGSLGPAGRLVIGGGW